jgi:hypothetical protein
MKEPANFELHLLYDVQHMSICSDAAAQLTIECMLNQTNEIHSKPLPCCVSSWPTGTGGTQFKMQGGTKKLFFKDDSPTVQANKCH